MKGKIIQQALNDFYSELSLISIPEDAVDITVPSPKTITNAQNETIPLINVCQPIVKPAEFLSVFKQVAEITKKHQPDLAEEIEQIEAALPAESDAQELFVSRAFIPGINLLAYLKQDVPPETFGFLLNHTVKPFMRQYGKLVGSFYDPEQWLKGSCPVCGSKPNMALLEKESGKRYLSCGLCETKWRFQRLGCPYCSNEQSEFFTVEGMEKYRVYFCKKCQGYIKTVDEKKTGDKEVNLFWEDINTVQLDILAMHEGYFNQPEPPPAKDTEK